MRGARRPVRLTFGSLAVKVAVLGLSLAACGADSEIRVIKNEHDLAACRGDLARAEERAMVCEQSLSKAALAMPRIQQIQGEIENLVPREVRVQVNDRVLALVRSIGQLAQENETASAERRRILQELTEANRVQQRLAAKEQEMKELRADLEARLQASDARRQEAQQAVARQSARLIESIRSFDERIDCRRCDHPVPITGLFRRHEDAKKEILDFHLRLLEELSGLPSGSDLETPPARPTS